MNDTKVSLNSFKKGEIKAKNPAPQRQGEAKKDIWDKLMSLIKIS
jgi:hypothetical protein